MLAVSRLQQLRALAPVLKTKFPDFSVKFQRLTTQWDELAEMERLEKDPLLREMAGQDRELVEAQMQDLLLNPSASSKYSSVFVSDQKDLFMELRAATGGAEAGHFAKDIMRMYERYCQWKRWRVSLVSESLDGQSLREATLSVSGDGCYRLLHRESGTHRVQRVPVTDSSGRVHTSTITVAVMPDIQDDKSDPDNIQLDPKELRIEVKRAQGPGGQHVNKTESAVRVTHLPTGMQVTIQQHREQHKNKSLALKILRARLFQRQMNEMQQSQSLERRRLIGQGMRSEKVRTYNFPQNRCTDHRLTGSGGDSFINLSRVMEGGEELDHLLTQLLLDDRVNRLAAACSN